MNEPHSDHDFLITVCNFKYVTNYYVITRPIERGVEQGHVAQAHGRGGPQIHIFIN
jgi:hypothetical protein